MKHSALLIFTILLLVAGQTMAAKVDNVELTWQDGFTVAQVDVEGTVRFSHQTEEAKDGRPFRVIVDVLSATHHLGQKKFSELPSCPIKHIRTSQYAVSPEKIVRLVFDMEHETVYRIDSDENSIKISFPDKNGQSFAAWSTSGWLARQQSTNERTTVAQAPAETNTAPSRTSAERLNKSIDNDRLTSLQADEPKIEPKHSGPTIAKPDTLSESLPSKPELASTDISEPTPEPGTSVVETDPAPEPVAKEAPKVAKKPVEKKSEPSPTVAQSQSAPSRTAPSRSVKAEPQPKSKSTPKTNVSTGGAPHPTAAGGSRGSVDKPVPSTTKPTPTAKPAPAKSAPAEQSQPAVDQADDKPQPRKRPTSRFRRSPTAPNKIRGTLVAEFPQRLTIKYKSRGHRDPFETLINETKQYNDPVERRIPNVDGLRLVGVIDAPYANSALFEDKDGYGYILKEGDKVRNGYVLKIKSEKVFFQIFEYGWSRTVALNLERN